MKLARYAAAGRQALCRAAWGFWAVPRGGAGSSGWMEQAAGTLSGGEQQMLAIARALMSQPRLVMFDEPSLGLAPALVEQVFAIVSEIRAGGDDGADGGADCDGGAGVV